MSDRLDSIDRIDPALFTPAPFDAAEAERSGYSRYSYWRSTIRTFFKSPLAIALLALITILTAFSFLYPLLSRTDPNAVALETARWNLKPGAGNGVFGTDGLGRDMWARSWHGARTSLLLGFVIAFIDVGIGMIAGALWGYVRRLDRIMTELYNVLTNIPQTVVLILLSYILRPGFWTIVIALCSTGWLSIARFVRNKVITIRDAEYNVASRCLGTPLSRIIAKNVLPYLVSIVIMEAALTIPYSIGAEVFLGFIGLGLPLDTVSLGNLVNLGKNNFFLYPHQLLWPTAVLATITVSFYIVGNKFADASDPRNHV
ncbi:MAG TPA: ABC transporter permease [Spirochaetaceae bacterium]|jgi:oligopeptide transport system permease protein|nr:ABC transporter permease [Spirochaetaceae bacterium]